MTFDVVGTDSAIEIPPDSVVDVSSDEPWPGQDGPGPFDDEAISEPPDPTNRPGRKSNDTPKAGPPRLDEWQDFFARVIIKTVTERWIDHIFAGIDEDELTPSELKRIYLSEEERQRIAKPFSELANKTKFTRRHGRTIIAATDSIDSVLALAMWFGRVNRIAAKHAKPRTVQGKVVRDVGTPEAPRNGANGTANGYPGQFQPWPESPGTG